MNETQIDGSDSPDDPFRSPTFYELLDVPENAEEEEIDHAFARALQDPDPDCRMNSSRKHAWEVLRDSINRSFYDEYLAKIRSKALVTSTSKPNRGVGSMSTFTLGSDRQTGVPGAPGEAKGRRAIRDAG